METVTELSHGHFHFKVLPEAQSTEPKLFVSTATLNRLITGVLNSLLDFAYNNAINRD